MKVWVCVALIFAQLSLCVSLRVVCYYFDDHWKNFPPKDIDPTLCTHFHLAFHLLDANKNVIVDHTGAARPALYSAVKALKKRNPKLKTLISLGGPVIYDNLFSAIVSDPKLRAGFIKNTIAYLKKYGFDGLSIAWQYPVCWAGDCTKGPASDKPNFGKLLLEFRHAFNLQKPRLLLSANVPGVRSGIPWDKAYDIPAMAKSLDYLCVQAWGITTPTDLHTSHSSEFAKFLNWPIPYINGSIPKAKVVIVVPFFGLAFTLQDPTQHTVGAPTTGVGNTPQGAKGWANYTEVCELVKNKGWTKERNKYGNDPIAYNGNIWTGYDDPWQVYTKAKWVKDQGYGGIMAMEVGMDDRHFCCTVRFPLLRAINNALFNTGKGISAYGCEHR